MPIDPQAQAFLDEVDSLQEPPFCAMALPEARAKAVANLTALGEPEPVARVEDRKIPGPLGEIPVRIYTPRGRGPFPVLVYYHGGGWVLCDLDSHDGPCRSIANAAACAVVSVDYRLAPEHKYPAAVEDACAAVQWVFEQAGSFGGDGRRVAVGGDSAGGNLATVVCLAARDRAASACVYQVLIYPVTDFDLDTPSYRENAEGCLLTRADMKWFWECYLDDEQRGAEPYASPLRAENLDGLPPALVITAEYDPLRDEGEAYAARLRQAGVPTVLSRYDGMIHGFVSRAAIFDQGKAALAEIGRTLKRSFAEAQLTSTDPSRHRPGRRP